MEFAPATYPPFPQGVPSVELETFSLAQLERGDAAAEGRLFETCKSRGFFYLNMDGSAAAASIWQDSEMLGRLAEAVFKLPKEEKEKYPMKDSIFGYKKAGQTRTDSHGTPDTAEFFNISKDAMLDNKTSNKLSWPAPVLAHKPLLARYMRAAHYTGTTVLAVLSRKLGLTDGGDSEGGGIKGLASYHRIDEASGDHVRLTRGPPRHSADLPEIQTPGHTDFGSITILFNWLGGLQVWSDPSRGETGFANIVDPGNGRQGDARSGGDGGGRWLWVIPPPPGTAIVNLGDAAVKFSGGVLCSGRHRVVPGPGEQGTLARYSVVYFVRPEDKTLLRRLRAPGIPEAAAGEDGEEPLNAKEWIIRQSAALGNKIERP